MLFAILFLVSLVIFVRLVLMLSFAGLLRLSLIPMVFLGILLVIFVLFVLANMMLRPELFPDMRPSVLLLMVLTFWNRKRRTMIEKILRLFKGIGTHFISGCSVCSGFARHIAKTVVQILKGGDTNKEP